MSPFKLYSGSGFDERTMEYFDFLNRPVRNIVKKTVRPGEDEYSFELYVREKKRWVRMIGAVEPELVGTADDIDVDMFVEPNSQHPKGDDVAAKLQHPAAAGQRLANGVVRVPRMAEVFVFEAQPKLVRCPNCGGTHMPISRARTPRSNVGKLARAGGPGDDPTKDTGPGEHFVSPKGGYCVFKGPQGYWAHFVPSTGEKVEQLGTSPSRKEMVDVILGHHDQKMAGLT